MYLKLNWELIIKFVLGAVAGVVVGYIVYALPAGAGGAMSFKSWLKYPVSKGIIWWAVGGGGYFVLCAKSRRDV
ncbi:MULTISPECIES: hypothetical protein [unclassified Maridesulfovibrio]|uniref:hypothetical protein n=1 Tax=unclassified Maridesulfovibrio TaxID=2794999 RepID=UPI003B425A35